RREDLQRPIGALTVLAMPCYEDAVASHRHVTGAVRDPILFPVNFDPVLERCDVPRELECVHTANRPLALPRLIPPKAAAQSFRLIRSELVVEGDDQSLVRIEIQKAPRNVNFREQSRVRRVAHIDAIEKIAPATGPFLQGHIVLSRDDIAGHKRPTGVTDPKTEPQVDSGGREVLSEASDRERLWYLERSSEHRMSRIGEREHVVDERRRYRLLRLFIKG